MLGYKPFSTDDWKEIYKAFIDCQKIRANYCNENGLKKEGKGKYPAFYLV
jgi:hypothetical protein